MPSKTPVEARGRPIVLHGYWRSGTSYRTRIALEYKQLTYTQVGYDLREGRHRSAEYLAVNPQGLVPALVYGTEIFTQSAAIIEWLDDEFPNPPLLPISPRDRAIVRAMAMTVACDVHPLNNLRVLQALRNDFSADDAAVQRWVSTWIHSGFAALEAMIAIHGGRFCFGNRFTSADCHLIPQVYSAERFGVALDAYPRIREVGEVTRNLEWVRAAHPDRQPDRDGMT